LAAQFDAAGTDARRDVGGELVDEGVHDALDLMRIRSDCAVTRSIGGRGTGMALEMWRRSRREGSGMSLGPPRPTSCRVETSKPGRVQAACMCAYGLMR
jgi:hypothetical protein